MKKVLCTFDQHGRQILEIFNEVILHSTALYDYKPRTLEQIEQWFKLKAENNFPVIGYESVNDAQDNEADTLSGRLMGFASYGSFRPFPAYKYTVEHSIYVHQDFRKQGLGKKLLQDVIDTAQAQDYHVVIGALDQANSGSIALHEQMGFTHCGTINQAAFKFNRWLNLVFYQKILSSPAQPCDG